ncbi:hypothetical protein ASPWEDRAFT_23231 [Aspergillus wentii DTO 134E9]|uniref:3-oxo-5-alpha-steroid 4-dehydrogenase C-terminal domain-containing protein n=1 Tax=Aspergillus wentii DTO 134E9 TaxID=1073089 RepID=A0A1L9S1T4_ASPWE|nr:uncharacterized protein ASPWEDRAFT_23231 [Aspergillus wentii DTO 134E9]KAI9930891.1 hypothetical protein MW887_010542 [Aspergillus wentii]OJJ41120.1 hypothetical protein ASPWEDRAFT_23231 [Aspergillus wentii DTO 134E9]
MGSIISSCVESLPPLVDFFPPTPEAYAVLLNGFQYFPVFTLIQWLLSFYPAGKKSMNSCLNFPGRVGWVIMELVAPINFLFVLWKLPQTLDIASLPLINKLVGSLYVIHYANRAVISPLFAAPSMSPIHALVVFAAVIFNWVNSSCIASWVVGYNVSTIGYKTDGGIPSSPQGGSGSGYLPYLGLVLFFTGMIGNIYSDRTLFRLRREEADRRAAKEDLDQNKNDSNNGQSTNKYFKVYVIPPCQGVFRSILYPNYAFEWIEWLGFILVGTAIFPARLPSAISSSPSYSTPPFRLAPWLVPAAVLAEKFNVPLSLPGLLFLVNEISTMLPNARWGRKWYVERFGEKAVGGRGAAVPWCSWL